MMTPEIAFQMVNTGALLAWMLLILAPDWQVTRAVVRSGLWPALLAVSYLGLVLFSFGDWPSDGSFNTLAGVAALFRSPWGLLTGWVHYLCFDMLVGLQISADADARGVGKWQRAPALLLCFLFGPVGWLTWQVTRRLVNRAA